MEFSIETPRLLIRPFTLGDTKEYFNMTKDSKIKKYVFYACFDTVGELEKAIRICYSVCDFKRDFYLILEEKFSHKIVGAFLITETKDKKIYEVCYFIGKTYRRKGYLKEAFTAFINEFPVSNATLCFTIDKTNKSSLNFVKSLDGIVEKHSNDPLFYNYKIFLYHIK